jgi:hypothetical protein
MPGAEWQANSAKRRPFAAPVIAADGPATTCATRSGACNLCCTHIYYSLNHKYIRVSFAS